MDKQPETPTKGWFKRALEKYDAFCKEMGIDTKPCRCAPIVKQDPPLDIKSKQSK